MAQEYIKYYKYLTVQGDTFDSIALDFYDEEIKAGIIMKSNPDYIGTLIFDQGISLRIPVIEESALSTLPPWR